MRSQNSSPTFLNNNSSSSSSSTTMNSSAFSNMDDDASSRIGTYCTLRTPISGGGNYKNITETDDINNRQRIDYTNYCTMGKNLRQIIEAQQQRQKPSNNRNFHRIDNNCLPYQKLNESSVDLLNDDNISSGIALTSTNYGLSNDLSTESLRLDCLDLSDDDNMNHKQGNFINHKQITLMQKPNTDQQPNYKTRQQQSSSAINNYLLEKLENRLADLNRTTPVGTMSTLQRAPTTITNTIRTVGGGVGDSTTMDRKKMNQQRDHFHPYCTLRHDKHTNKSIVDDNSLMIPAKQIPITFTDDQCRSSTGNHVVSDPYCSMTHQESIAEAYNILNELDAILANTEITSSSSSNRSSRSTSPHSFKPEQQLITLDRTEPQQIEDCLLELDNYLDEIDRESPKLFLDDDDIAVAHKTINDHLKRSNTLPKNLNSNRNNELNKRKDINVLERGNNLRSTIAGLRHKIEKSKTIRRHCSNSNSSNNHLRDGDLNFSNQVKDQLTNIPSSQPRKTWRRNSMRKTALLTLPEQQKYQTQLLGRHNDAQQINIPIAENDLLTNRLNVQEESTSTAFGMNNLELILNVNSINSSHHDNMMQETIQTTDGRRSLSQNDCTQLESLDQLDIIHDILNNSIAHNDDDTVASSDENRPRQIGRRAEAHPRLLSITTDTNDSGHRRIIMNHDRPMSAPAASTARRNGIPAISPLLANDTDITRRYIGSEASSVGSSRNPSPVSLLSSTGSSSLASTHHGQEVDTVPPHISRPTPLDPDNIPMPRSRGINTHWPHDFSRILALLCCTLGLFNISRFAILTVHYGGNFLLQFLILSIIFGIPMLWLQMCLGSKIKSGPVSMWKITPICRGIGIALCLAQCVIALYTTISLSWVLVYFRDSFVRKNEYYKWQESFVIYRHHGSVPPNLTETIPDYFNAIVLGRRIETGGVRFQLAFNLAIIWTGVFLVLCKGLKSYGKIVLGLTTVPLVLFIAITCKFLYIIDFSTVQNIFSAADFEDFLINSKTWTAAAQETFLTWVLLGPSVISLCSRSTEKCPSKTVLRRDAIVVVLLTLVGLSVSAIFGYACVQILLNHGYIYLPGSYEHMNSYMFLFSLKTPIPPEFISIPTKWTSHYSTVLGDIFRQPWSSPYLESGYQSLRLITELFPAVVTVAEDQISSVWTVLGYLAFLIFGLAQLCAMWKPISGALGNSSSSVLLSCVTGLLLGIPFATETGLSIIHFLDMIIGGAWWILILWTAQILGVFLIRGRPYNGDVLVNDLRMTGSMSAFLALSWNVLLPIGLVTLAVIQYRVSGSNQFFYWRGKSYFHFWSRKAGGLIQISFLLLIPITAIVQIYRYLSSGPPDILDRIQLLYRPTQSPLPHRRNLSNTNNNRTTSSQHTATATGGNLNSSENQAAQDDAPPKYTPPPSYTTATGARLAKMLRQSIRRSVRRILGEPSRTRPILPPSHDETSLPPEYSTVLSDPSGSSNMADIEIGPRALYNSYTHRTLSLERERPFPSREVMSTATTSTTTTLPNRPSSASNTHGTANNRLGPNFTALDVAHILKTTAHRHERSASALAARVDNVLRASSLRCNLSRSAENLVLNAAPLGQSSAIVLNYEDDVKHLNSENTSVI